MSFTAAGLKAPLGTGVTRIANANPNGAPTLPTLAFLQALRELFARISDAFSAQRKAAGPPTDPVEVTSAAAIYSQARFILVKDDVRQHVGWVETVHVTGDKYVVFTDVNHHPHYQRDIGTPEPKGFNGVWNAVLAVDGLPRTNLSATEVQHVASRLASVVSTGLEGDVEHALQLVESTRTFVESTSRRISQGRYLIGAMCGSGLLFALGLWLMPPAILKDGAAPLVFVNQVAAIGLAGGGIGSLLSAAGRRVDDHHFEPYARLLAGCLSGAVRALYGSVSAIVVVLAFSSNIVSTPAMSDGNRFAVLWLLGCLGGFGERWAEDVITVVRGTVSAANESKRKEAVKSA